ncbi:hypothetical protein SPLA10_PHROGS00116 [Salmonella phage SPLA10]|nr:hypothetical protein [Escherichia coli]WNT47177.1 hypothetical protein SPLA10_PHROGS00116 [Salmonella phage SPLA10]
MNELFSLLRWIARTLIRFVFKTALRSVFWALVIFGPVIYVATHFNF